MFRSNNGLKSSHPYDSRPSQWPLLHRGISFWRATPDTHGIYLIGNPLPWFLGTLSVVLFVAFTIVSIFLEKRQIVFHQSGFVKDAVSGLWFHSLGYFCHYLPFFLMQRQVPLELIIVVFASLFTQSILFHSVWWGDS
jgi:dolichyl-phosphate-mannose-protein mannosyltransferase